MRVSWHGPLVFTIDSLIFPCFSVCYICSYLFFTLFFTVPVSWSEWTTLAPCDAFCENVIRPGQISMSRTCLNHGQGDECTKMDGSTGLQESSIELCNTEEQCPSKKWPHSYSFIPKQIKSVGEGKKAVK